MQVPCGIGSDTLQFGAAGRTGTLNLGCTAATVSRPTRTALRSGVKPGHDSSFAMPDELGAEQRGLADVATDRGAHSLW